jgi:hypothetical protein
LYAGAIGVDVKESPQVCVGFYRRKALVNELCAAEE